MSEILIENFRSLSLIFSLFNQIKNEELSELGEIDKENFEDLKHFFEVNDDSEINLWLTELDQRIYLFKKSLKKYRLTLLNLMDHDEENHEKVDGEIKKRAVFDIEKIVRLRKSPIGNFIYKLAEGSGTSVNSCLNELDEVKGIPREFDHRRHKKNWNMKNNLNVIGKMLNFSK